jgi:hypothetical protein
MTATGQETSGSQGLSRAEASRIARGRFGATRTDYRESAHKDAAGSHARCTIYCRDYKGEVCIGGGPTWEAALADADRLHTGKPR